jgi:hypothetical protein
LLPGNEREIDMTRPLLLISAAGAVLVLAGCSGEKSDTPAGGETSSPAVAVTASPAENAQTIPQAVQGRWGLVPADCTTTRGDDKGLLVIGPDSLKFYESQGKLGQIAERSDTRIRASFAFTGEGMEWTHDVVLDTQDGGKTLIRQNFGPDAEPGPYKYTRC